MNKNEELDIILTTHRKQVRKFTDLRDSTYAVIFQTAKAAATFYAAFRNISDQADMDLINPPNSPYVRIGFGSAELSARKALTASLYRIEPKLPREKGILPKLGPEECRLLGFLYRNASIIAKVTRLGEDEFINNYLDIKGVFPYEKKGYHINICEGTWTHSMDVRVKEKTNHEKFSWPVLPYIYDGYIRFYNTDWCWELLERGFDLGNEEHDEKQILSHVAEEYKKYFNAGTVA